MLFVLLLGNVLLVVRTLAPSLVLHVPVHARVCLQLFLVEDRPQGTVRKAVTLRHAPSARQLGPLFRVFLLASSLGRSSSPEWSARARDGVVANTHTDVARYALLDVSFLSRNDRLTDLEGGLALAKSAVHIAMLGGAAECASRHTGLVNRVLVHNLFSVRAHELAAGALVVRPYSTS